MALSFHPLFIGGDPRRVTSMYILVVIWKSLRCPLRPGGVQALADAMGNVVKRLGGSFFLIRCGGNLSDKGKASGVKLSDGQTIKSDIVVSNADPGWTYKNLIKKSSKSRWTDKRLSQSKWSMGLFVWYFGTKGTKIIGRM